MQDEVAKINFLIAYLSRNPRWSLTLKCFARLISSPYAGVCQGNVGFVRDTSNCRLADFGWI